MIFSRSDIFPCLQLFAEALAPDCDALSRDAPIICIDFVDYYGGHLRVFPEHVEQELCDASDQFGFLRRRRLFFRDSDVDEWHCFLLYAAGSAKNHAAWAGLAVEALFAASKAIHSTRCLVPSTHFFSLSRFIIQDKLDTSIV
jgi:hypothetical protein